MSWIITGTEKLPSDPDAAAYIANVEAVDGQELEYDVRMAINAFVLGCKADGIWDAIKASCILAGARTLDGALVPLAGTAPTNYNFVSADYNRKTGLVGDGSTKYLDSNRNNNMDPQDSKHISVFTTDRSQTTGAAFIGSFALASGGSWITFSFSGLFPLLLRINAASSSGDIPQVSIPTTNTFLGASRASASIQALRAAGTTTNYTQSSVTPVNENIRIFAGASSFNSSRIAFYSIGESLDLALLDARVTTLITAIAAAIP